MNPLSAVALWIAYVFAGLLALSIMSEVFKVRGNNGLAALIIMALWPVTLPLVMIIWLVRQFEPI